MARTMLPFGRRDDDGPTGRDVADESVSTPAPLTVSALVAAIKEALLDAFEPKVVVVGEVSNFSRPSSGHLYFSLKDDNATISAVMFRGAASSVRFDLADGLEVVAEGRVDVYDKQGRLQLYVQRLTPRGAGALELAFRQLKRRLEDEGLFEEDRKKPLVRFPRAVGVVTSPTGAAIRDISQTLGRRWPAAKVYLLGVRVQGESAAGEIAQAIADLDAAAPELGIDTIIVGRGGGSLEDLWAFNEEAVARSIFAASTPIISAVGHEVDFTIADFVADVRAATPTAGAELAVPDGVELARHVTTLAGRLSRRMDERAASARTALSAALRSVVFRDPSWQVRSAQQGLDELTGRLRAALDQCRHLREQRLHRTERRLAAQQPRHLLERAVGRIEQLRRDLAWVLSRRAKSAGDDLTGRAARLAAAHPRYRLRLACQRIDALGRQLDAMSYRAAIRRGYTVTRIKGGAVLRSAAAVGPGDVLETELVDGKIASRVDGIAPTRKRRSGHPPAGDTPGLFGDLTEG